MEFAEFERRLTAARSMPAVVNMPPEFSAFSDGACADQVDFWFHDDHRREPQAADFLDFLVIQGLRQEL